ncbi:M23 family metallopeptidase [Leptospira borgpetersenii]|uniref:Peptidase, M23 family n=2 Tax=Leptospira borgpetersenii TaxID=174 RepID=M3HN53_LEPBO|nr:M23 family metallopeptidase [Leptospira borgpetersenii]EKP13035.1 peptidase, M23 family [Leptospira borgpetersenii str. 200801926]EMF99490.1 peptidase, M23 family [Leptospira borgpetersenii str. 200701203]ENO65433.1 peptidase, M23 family [Leptospira borgpetersenii serovar Mini str. 201000851]
MILQILNLLIPLVRKFLNLKAIQTNQNYWNKSLVAIDNTKKISREEAFDTISDIPVQRIPIFRLPVSNPHITSPYGYRYLNIDGKKSKQFHLGIDLGGYNDVFAPEDCVIETVLGRDRKYPVKFRWEKNTWVNLVKSGEVPEDRAWTPYVLAIGVHTKNRYKLKHTDPRVKKGDKVSAGDLIGKSGNYGYSLGAHLHFEVWPWDEKAQDWKKETDPEKFLKEKGLL